MHVIGKRNDIPDEINDLVCRPGNAYIAVIKAASAEEARQIAHDTGGMMIEGVPDFWLNEEYTACIELNYSLPNAWVALI